MVTWRHGAVLALLLAAGCNAGPSEREQQLAAQNDEAAWPKIINGEKVTGATPWQVALVRADRSNTLWAQFCGGVLIGPQHVLTAAHCFKDYPDPKNQVDVYVDAQALGSRGRRIVITGYSPHHQYDPANRDYDFAILRLEEPVIPAHQAIVLPTAQSEAHLDNGSELITFGWGYTRVGGSKSYDLLQLDLTYVRNDTCNLPQSYNGAVTPRMLCAKSDSGGDTCQGDSGGPLLDRNSRVLLGIVSGGRGCAREYKFGIYSRVTAVRPWIDEMIGARR